MTRTFFAVVRRDIALALRRRSDVLNTLVFFVIVTSLFPLGVGAEKNLLTSIAPGILWVAALLAAVLSLVRMFEADYADGTLEQLALAPQPLTIIVLAKIFAHWLLTGLPLTLLAPVLALQFNLSPSAIGLLTATLAIGTPVFSLLGAVVAGLTLGLRGGGVLAALLVLPLYVPVLIFGAGAVGVAESGLDAASHLLLLGAALLCALALAPWAAAAALRVALDS